MKLYRVKYGYEVVVLADNTKEVEDIVKSSVSGCLPDFIEVVREIRNLKHLPKGWTKLNKAWYSRREMFTYGGIVIGNLLKRIKREEKKGENSH